MKREKPGNSRFFNLWIRRRPSRLDSKCNSFNICSTRTSRSTIIGVNLVRLATHIRTIRIGQNSTTRTNNLTTCHRLWIQLSCHRPLQSKPQQNHSIVPWFRLRRRKKRRRRRRFSSSMSQLMRKSHWKMRRKLIYPIWTMVTKKSSLILAPTSKARTTLERLTRAVGQWSTTASWLAMTLNRTHQPWTTFRHCRVSNSTRAGNVKESC